MEDIFRGVGVEVTLPEPDNFLKIKETLTRIGIASRKERKLYQTCHILHKQGRYVIIHFKELFILDGKEDNFVDDDKARRNTIVNLLEEWKFVHQVKLLHLIQTDQIRLDDKYLFRAFERDLLPRSYAYHYQGQQVQFESRLDLLKVF